jgi:hypothetical protein
MIFVKLNNKHALYIEYIQMRLKLFDYLVGKSHLFSRNGTDIQNKNGHLMCVTYRCKFMVSEKKK